MAESRTRKLPPGIPEELMAAFTELLKKAVSFHPALARVCGSAAAGLMCDQGMFWSGMPSVQQNDGWFYKSAKEWEEETCLSRREQDTAKKILKKKGFMETKLAKVNGAPTLHFRMNVPAILEAHIKQNQCTDQPNGLHQNAKSDCTETPDGKHESAKTIDCTDQPNPLHKSAKSYKEQESTSESTQESGERRRKMSKSERDSWDLRRWQAEMRKTDPQPGAHIGDPDAHWRSRAKAAAFEAGLSPQRLVELLHQHFPDDTDIDLIYQQKPLFGETA